MTEAIVTRAAVLDEIGGSLLVQDLELAPPSRGEVRVRIEASGVCHSDWNAVSGSSPSPLPAVLGHEGAGVVEEIGAGVTTVAVGDQVVLSWLPTCGRCRRCQEGRLSLCEVATKDMGIGALPGGGIRLARGGLPIHHYSYLSTFARHAVVSARSCIVLPPDTDLEVAALVGCAVMTGIGAVINRAKVTPGSSVAVFGAGGVGLSAIMGARLAGAGTIIAVEPVESKRALALELGATVALDGNDAGLLEALLDHSGGGLDYAFEAAGLTRLTELAFAATRPGGMIVAVGVPPLSSTVALPGPELVRSEKIVTGTFYGSSRPALDMPMILRLHAEGRLPLDRLVTRRYPLEGVNAAFEDMNTGEVARGVLRPWEEDGVADR
ncbi:MAG TPA: Zn-dependent alcohol dehydrogenase [Acidimicrobiales bacterium]|nr:Zn-dependent alcohol dehydrogenase [Acidimicrobiales bacterium]